MRPSPPAARAAARAEHERLVARREHEPPGPRSEVGGRAERSDLTGIPPGVAPGGWNTISGITQPGESAEAS